MATIPASVHAPLFDVRTGMLTPYGKAFLDSLRSDAVGDDTLEGQDGAFYLARENHTGTQSIATVDGLETALDSKITALADPNADRIFFWDDSAGTWAFLTVGAFLEIDGTTLNATSPPQTYSRITAAGDVRITADGDIRITD
jgi:hypothetical protein